MNGGNNNYDPDKGNGIALGILFIVMILGLACWAFGGIIYTLIVNL